MTNDPRAGGTDLHASHDPLLIAALAAGDLAPAERTAAEALVAACHECRLLADDLVALSHAVRSDLPMPRRRRDFRLTEADAQRLRGGSPLRRLLERVGSPGFAILQPLGGVAAALGVALVVLTGGVLPVATPAAAPQGAGGDTSQEVFMMSPGAAPAGASAPAEEATPVTGMGGAPAGGPPEDSSAQTDTPGGEGRTAADPGVQVEALDVADVTGPSPGVLVGGGLIVAGLGVLALRWLGGRLRRLR